LNRSAPDLDCLKTWDNLTWREGQMGGRPALSAAWNSEALEWAIREYHAIQKLVLRSPIQCFQPLLC